MHLARLTTAVAVSALLCGAAQAQSPAGQAQAPAQAAPAGAPAQSVAPAATPAANGDLVQTAQAAGQFTTLLKAADATGLTPVLKRPGTLTVFAPTDAAFAALPPGELDRLMADKAALQSVLLGHVVNTAAPSSSLKGKKGTVQNGAGQSLTVDGSGDQLKVNNATVVQADIRASNGIIHVVDKVIMPGGAATAAAAPSGESADAATTAPAAPSAGRAPGATASTPAQPAGTTPPATTPPTR